MTSVRVDAWAWAVRLYKTRSAASDACKAGHLKVNGDRAKPAQQAVSHAQWANGVGCWAVIVSDADPAQTSRTPRRTASTLARQG